MFWLVFSVNVIIFTYLGAPNNNSLRGNSAKLIFRILLILSLSLLISLGGIVGTDHQGYADWYNKLASFDFLNFLTSMDLNELSRADDDYEIGFVLLGCLLHMLGFSAIGFFFVVAFVTNYLFVKVLYRFKHPVFSIVIFLVLQYYFQECNLVRQMLATSVFLYSLKFLEEKKVKNYLICIIVAASFHYSAIFLISLVFLCYVNYEKYGLALIGIYSIIWLLSLLIILNYVTFDSFFESFSIGYYQIYFDNLYGLGHDQQPFEIRYNIITFVILLTSFVALWKNRLNTSIRYCYLLIFVLGVFMANISIKFYWLYRVAVYFATLFCFVTPEFLSKIKVFKTEKNYSIFELVVMMLYFSDLIFKYIMNPNVILGSKFVF